MQPDLTISNDNKTVDIYNRGRHYSLEYYEDGVWRQVRIATTIEEAKFMAEYHVGITSAKLLREDI